MKHGDRVQETTATTGTGTLTLGGATDGRRTFLAEIGETELCTYLIESSNGAWELSQGEITDTAGTITLTRTLIKSSTGSLLDLPQGTHKVSQVQVADEVNNPTPKTITQPEYSIGNLGAGYTFAAADGNSQAGNVDQTTTVTAPAQFPTTTVKIVLRLTNTVAAAAITVVGATPIGGTAPEFDDADGVDNLLIFYGSQGGWSYDGGKA